ncbi:HYLS1 protein, partial [Eurystomus gularis]|nr:HYLS1 protein [Eurystomus gularis]
EKIGPDTYGWASLEDEEQLAATLALYTQRGADQEPAHPHHDPYAEASLTLGPQPAEDGRRRKRLVMKRKVLRRTPDGGVEVSDESTTSKPESEAELWGLRQKMLQLRVDPDDSISEGEIETSSSSSDESHGDDPCFFLRDFGSRSSSASLYPTTAGQPKSFIPPRLDTLGRNRGKADPVAKYFEYKREWEKFHIPGEERWQELRWDIREQMLCRPEPPGKPRPPHVPNTYTVPTAKKRAALRWEVRCDLARGLPPRK